MKNKNYYFIVKKSIKIYEKGYLVDNMNIPNFKDKKVFNKFILFLNKYIENSIVTVDKLKHSGSLNRFEKFSSFFKKEIVYDIKDYKLYLNFLDKIRSVFKFDIKNIISFLYRQGINLILIPANDHYNKDFIRYVESVSLFIKGVPTIIVFLSNNTLLNKRVFSNIFYSIYYLIFPYSSYMKANKFSYNMLLSEDIILGDLDKKMKGEFLLSLKNDKDLAKKVFSRVFIKTGIPIINIIKTLLSIDYLDRYKNEGYFKDVIDSLNKDITLGLLKPEPISLENMASYLNRNKFLLNKKD